VSSVSSINSSSAADALSARTSQSLNSDEFLKIMIAELTNQDPFEPMKNADLLNQMTAIQQLQSSQDMSKRFATLMDSFDGLLARQDKSAAAGLIGQLVSGTSTTGQFAMGKVTAVTVDDQDILLQLDTGQTINMNDIIRLGGRNSADIVGSTVVGTTLGNVEVIGKVVSMEANGSQVMLNLLLPNASEDQTVSVPMSTATVIDKDTADMLIGYDVKGYNTDDQLVAGTVISVEWTDTDVVLHLGDNDKISLDRLVSIN